MKWLAIIFAAATVICSLGTGNLPQINNIARTAEKVFHLPLWGVGGVLSVLLFLIIIGGIKRITQVTEKIVPIMAIIYIVGALTILLSHYENILPSFTKLKRKVFIGVYVSTLPIVPLNSPETTATSTFLSSEK